MLTPFIISSVGLILNSPLSRIIAKIAAGIGLVIIILVFFTLGMNVYNNLSMKHDEIDRILSQISAINSRDSEIINEQKKILDSHDTFLNSLYKTLKNIEQNKTNYDFYLN